MTNPRNATTTTSGRYYTWSEERYDSVTTTISRGVPKPFLKPWGQKMVAAAAVRHRSSWEQMDDEDAIDWLKRAPDRDTEKAAAQGSDVHAWAEAVALGQDVTVEAMPEAQQGYGTSFMRFRDEMAPVWEVSEASVFSRRYGYAGTLDALMRIPLLGEGLGIVDYKGLDLTTPLPTPTGWTTMGAVQVGDQVLGSDGRPCTVIHKSRLRERPCYRITFDDASSVVCDDEHLWSVVGGRTHRPIESVLSTAEIARTLHDARQRQYRIVNAAPLDLPEATLPIHPYVLGCWLGDGKAAGGSITKPDDELFENITACGYRVSPAHHSKRGDVRTSTVYGLQTQLRLNGILGNKHVPDAYLRGSYQQRLALLQGLMDTDGSWNRERHQANFVSTDKALTAAVHELVVSLGWRASTHVHDAHGYGLTVTAHSVYFTPFGANPFRLSRKADLVRPEGTAVCRRRLIHSVERTIDVMTQCIGVDSPDNTYLCGEEMVPTHNTSRSGIYPEVALQLAAYRNADFIGLPDGSEIPMPEVTWSAALHITPSGYHLIPVDSGPLAFEFFLAVQQVADFTENVGKQLLGDEIHPQLALVVN